MLCLFPKIYLQLSRQITGINRENIQYSCICIFNLQVLSGYIQLI